MKNETLRQLQTGQGPVPWTKDISHNRVPLRLYSIGWLSYITLFASVTLRLWERQKILPKPVFALPSGGRWYSPAELTAFRTAIEFYVTNGRDKEVLRKQMAAASLKIRRVYSSITPEAAGKMDPAYFKLPSEGIYSKENRRKAHLVGSVIATLEKIQKSNEAKYNRSEDHPQESDTLGIRRSARPLQPVHKAVAQLPKRGSKHRDNPARGKL
jgi:hypothetical protein